MKDPDNGYAAILDIQAGHSSAVAEALYGVEGRDFPSSVRSSEYVSFKVVCLSLHHFYDIADHSECKLNSPPPLRLIDGILIHLRPCKYGSNSAFLSQRDQGCPSPSDLYPYRLHANKENETP